MTPHQRLVDTARRARQPLYLVTALYVGVGFVVGAYGALAGDRLAAFLGFLFVSGALCGALVFHTMARLAVRISAIGDSLDALRLSLNRIDARLLPPAGTHISEERARDTDLLPPLPAHSDVRVLDLADLGHADPSLLAAAVLDRDRFPRLVTTMDEESAASVEEDATTGNAPGESTDLPSGASPGGIGADQNLLWRWKMARRDGDLQTCRSIFSTIIDTADSQLVADLAVQMKEVSELAERSLRVKFAECVRGGDFAGALKIGNQIGALFAQEPVAEEFERIRPLLLRKLGAQRSSTDPSRAVAGS